MAVSFASNVGNLAAKVRDSFPDTNALAGAKPLAMTLSNPALASSAAAGSLSSQSFGAQAISGGLAL